MSFKEGFIYFANIAYELGKWAFAILIIGTVLHYFVITLFVISGPSMETSFHDKQIVLVSRIGLFTGSYRRGDPMVLKFPGDPEHKKYIKRLVGMPGDTLTIKDNKVYINEKLIVETYVKPVGEEFLPFYYNTEKEEQMADLLHSQGQVLVQPDLTVTLGRDDYFFMGDNRENSNDSRAWYPASKSDIIGPVRFIVWPLKDWGPVVNPYYSS